MSQCIPSTTIIEWKIKIRFFFYFKMVGIILTQIYWILLFSYSGNWGSEEAGDLLKVT
jgi:hypothetical protein